MGLGRRLSFAWELTKWEAENLDRGSLFWVRMVYLRVYIICWGGGLIVLLDAAVECFSLGFGQGSQQLLGDPFPGVRKPMSPVAAQVRLKCFLLVC